jgi:hypothetical protein
MLNNLEKKEKLLKEQAYRDYYFWTKRDDFRRLLERLLLNKISGCDFIVAYYLLFDKTKNSFFWIAPSDSYPIHSKGEGITEILSELIRFDVILGFGDLVCQEEDDREENGGSSYYYLNMYKDGARDIYEKLLVFEDNSSIRNVVDEKVLQQTMIFFSFGSLVAYSILKPGFLSFFSNF